MPALTRIGDAVLFSAFVVICLAEEAFDEWQARRTATQTGVGRFFYAR